MIDIEHYLPKKVPIPHKIHADVNTAYTFHKLTILSFDFMNDLMPLCCTTEGLH